MDAGKIHGLLADAVARLPDANPDARRALYARALQSIENSCRREDGSLDEARYAVLKQRAEAAMARIEQEHSAAGMPPSRHSGAGGFVLPDDAPKSAGEYLWLKALGICGAIGTVIDFLKPLATLQSAAFFMSLLLAALCHAALRLDWSGTRWLKLGRLSGGLVAALMLGFFGLDSVIPGDQPNGLLAETIPAVAALQASMLSDIKAGLGRVEKVTAGIDGTTRETRETATRIEQQTAAIADGVQEMAAAADPAKAARKAIVAAGFTPDLPGYVAAVASGSMAQYQFVDFGLPVSVADFEAALLGFRYDTPEFANFIDGPLVYDSRFRSVRATLDSAFARERGGVLDVSAAYRASCGQGEGGFMDRLYRANLAGSCADTEAWLSDAKGLLKAIGGALHPRLPSLRLSQG